MKKAYKPIEFKVQQHLFKIQLKEEALQINVNGEKEHFGATIWRQDFPEHLKLNFITLENIYWYFRDLSGSIQKCPENVSVKGSMLVLKVKQNISGIDVIKQSTINLSELRKERAGSGKDDQRIEIYDLGTSNTINSPANTKEECVTPNINQIIQSAQASKLNLKLEEMANRIVRLEQELVHFKKSDIEQSVEQKIRTFEKKQGFIVSKIMNNEEKILKLHNDKKEVKKLFEASVEEIWNEINCIRTSMQNLPKIIYQDYNQESSKSSMDYTDSNGNNYTHTKHGDLNRGDVFIKKKDTLESEENYVELPEGPIHYVRNSGNLEGSIGRVRQWSVSLSEEQLDRIKHGSMDIELFKKKLRELDRKLQINIPAKQIELKFRESPYLNKFKVENEKGNSYTLLKKSVDKKYQLVGEPLPESGKCYFRFKLVAVPHGYIHLGVVAGHAELQQSSYMSDTCVNYFGGNGSLNDKGNGVFIGKQLQNGDIVTLLVNMDDKKIIFILRGHVLGQGMLAGIDLSKGLLPYVELFYGGSKIEVAND